MGAFSGNKNPMVLGVSMSTIKMERISKNPFRIRFKISFFISL
jgi:hypothetical protein